MAMSAHRHSWPRQAPGISQAILHIKHCCGQECPRACGWVEMRRFLKRPAELACYRPPFAVLIGSVWVVRGLMGSSGSAWSTGCTVSDRDQELSQRGTYEL